MRWIIPGIAHLLKTYFDLGAAVLMVIVLALAHGYLTAGSLTIEYELHPDTAGRTQIYWTTGERFSEDRQYVRILRADSHNEVSAHITADSPINWIRIDPLKALGVFRIRNVRVEFTASLLPVGVFQSWTLKAEDAAEIHQLKRRGSQEWEATGNDPYFLFRVPRLSVSGTFIVNLLAGFALVFCVVLLIRASAASGYATASLYAASSMVVLGIYGVFFVMALISNEYTSLQRFSRTVVYLVLMVWIVSYFLVGRGLITGVFVRAASVLLSIAIIILPDVWFHIGAVDRPMFSRFTTPLYHWQLGKTSEDNFINSSLRYYGDFKELANLIVPGSYFLSDVATSYYASVALPLYAVHVLRHHRYGVTPISPEMVAKLCGKIEVREDQVFLDYFEDKRKMHASNGMDPLRYWLANKDKENRHVRADCLSRHQEFVKKRLASMLTQIYAGKYIDVYEFHYQ